MPPDKAIVFALAIAKALFVSWGTGTAFLSRTGDLDDLAADRGIDLEAVRATPKGHRSLLAR